MFIDLRSNSLDNLTASSFLFEFFKKRISAHEYAKSIVDRINKYEKVLGAWVCFDLDDLLKNAKKIDNNLKLYQNMPLVGVPVGIKDIFNTANFPTRFGSNIKYNINPGNDARVVTSLKNSGALIVGKTTTAEFGVHSHPITKNPYNFERICGTSSTGSAVAVCSNMIPVAIGSQTAGSTSRPSSYLGIYGFKPSFGTLPRTAMLKTTDTLDSVTILARCVDDLKLMFNSMRVYGRNYPIVNKKLKECNIKKKIRIGVINGPKSKLTHKKVKEKFKITCEKLSNHGFILDQLLIPEFFNEAHERHELIYCKSLSYYLKNEWNNHKNKFSKRLSSMIIRGFSISNEQYFDSLRWQSKAQRIFEKTIKNFDCLICPSTADNAPLISHEEINDHNLIWTLCRATTITIPGLKGSNNLPVGLEIIGKRFNDYKILEYAKIIDKIIN